jgi:hypothetical protein
VDDLTEAELKLTVRALLYFASGLLRESRSRKWAGPKRAAVRAQFRREAAELKQLADRIERNTGTST